MSDAHSILTRAQRIGLRLCVEGERIAITPARLCPPELLDRIREYKPEIMSFLEARGYHLPADCAPWLHVAKQVLADEFHDCDRSTRESLNIGLRSIAHPLCQRAIEKLRTEAKQHEKT
jgi:hypothetical protein